MAEDLSKCKPDKESMTTQDSSDSSAKQQDAKSTNEAIEVPNNDGENDRGLESTAEPSGATKTGKLEDERTSNDAAKSSKGLGKSEQTAPGHSDGGDKSATQTPKSTSGETPTVSLASNEHSTSEPSNRITQTPASSKKESTTDSPETEADQSEGSNNKRKLPSGGTGNPASATTLSTPSLADSPVVTRMVQNIFTLLMTYGPMTQPQLEFNLPPLQGERLNQHNFIDILELLVATGLLQKEDVSATAGEGGAVVEPRYCVLSGATRQHPTTPAKVLQEIQEVQDEWRTSLQRQEKLQQALLDPSVQPRDSLKALLLQFPEITYDPVYVAALRNLNVDAGSVLDQRQSGSRPRSSAKRRRRSSANPSSTQSKGTSTATTATKPKLTAAEDKGSKETTAKAPAVSAKTIPKEGGEP